MVSAGFRSDALAIQVVAGSPSKALLGWSCGVEVNTDDAVAVASCRSKRAYRSMSGESVRTAEPRSVAGPAAGTVKPWSKPYCSSVAVPSSEEQTQRSEVSMQSEGCGWALASTTAAGLAAPGTGGATISRPAVTPGTLMAAMPTWGPNAGAGGG